MRKYQGNSKGASFAEVTIFIAIVAAAMIATLPFFTETTKATLCNDLFGQELYGEDGFFNPFGIDFNWRKNQKQCRRSNQVLF